MGSHDHLRGAGMGEAWNDPERPPRPDRGEYSYDHRIINGVQGWVRRGKTPSAHLDPIEVVMHVIT